MQLLFWGCPLAFTRRVIRLLSMVPSRLNPVNHKSLTIPMMHAIRGALPNSTFDEVLYGHAQSGHLDENVSRRTTKSGRLR